MTYNNLTPQQNWSSLGAGGMYGSFNYGGGGIPVARSDLDFMRMGVGRVPHAEYPDGYLGTIRSRRDDKGKPNSISEIVLDGMKTRVNQRAYQRGVHKGERIDPGDYVWPTEWGAETGISNQFKGRKTNLVNLPVQPTHLVNDGRSDIPNNVPPEMGPRRRAQLDRLRPAWA
jgi:hypothetical protein